MFKHNLILVFLFFIKIISAQNTEKLFLSGAGLWDTKKWDFFCSDGKNSGKWTKIDVPSQWELQGYGEYTYGRFYLDKEAKPSSEIGIYRHKFTIPNTWKGKSVNIVFEGVMTDAEVKVNGKLAGDIHQGGFYEFNYDISDKIKYGKLNILEVKVWKESSNQSVNKAERRADWWLFGGIYRPVYLTAKPKTHIQRIAVNATAVGKLTTEVFFKNLPAGFAIAAQIFPVASAQKYPRKVIKLSAQKQQTIQTSWENINTWDPENPNLYTLKLELLNEKSEVVHIHQERIGFRTVEFKPKDGLYVNSIKTIMKGINRHSFHPDGGRTTNKQISLEDALLIKEMNMNAVRSHYPPDKHFLDMCDSLGLFYLNELAGWHDAYDTTVGKKLLEEMVVRDVNHPCIFMWANGNEGGWNKNLNALFDDFDPQKRHVIHPWADFNGIDTHHYPAYQTGTAKLANGYKVFMPTEFLHGLYDRGHGAGLEDYWNLFTSHPMFAGGFLWSFVDEAVKRTDKNGLLDSDGPNGPDGIVGPYRQKEGSFFTVREVWAPIQFDNLVITKSFKGEFPIKNSYLYTSLKECTMKYRLYSCSSPFNKNEQKIINEGAVALPPLNPGEKGVAKMKIPENFFSGDLLELEAFDKFGKSVCTWTWPVKFTGEYFNSQITDKSVQNFATIDNRNDQTKLSANGVTAIFNSKTGILEKVYCNSIEIPFNNGPVTVGMSVKFKSSYTRMNGADALFVVRYTGAIDSIVWRMKPNGLLGMDAVMLNKENGGGFDGKFFDDKIYNFGISFSYPEKEVKGMRWFGRGPYRVWKNRIKGTNYGIWEKQYNNTITGDNFENIVYPEFKGYHANLYWATLMSEKSNFTVYTETDGVFFRVFTPEEPPLRRNGENSMWKFPDGDISFLLDIPAMRSFKTIPEHGPKSQPSTIRIKQGDEGIRLNLWFDFRK